MVKTFTLNRKLKSYSVLAGTIVAANAQGQVVYTDISPDSTVNVDGGYYDLDLNNDGVVDFRFSETIYTGSTAAYSKVGITTLDSNQVAGSVNGSYIYPFTMNPGDTVQASLTWNIGGQSMGSYFGAGYTYGNWPGVNDKYVGLRLNVEGDIYYGWARLDVAPIGDSFVIKDYAYRNAVNQPIVIDINTGINESHDLTGVSIHSNGSTIYVNSTSEIDGILSVSNILGQEILNQSINEQHSTIELENVQTGIYFVSVISEGKRIVKKIILK